MTVTALSNEPFERRTPGLANDARRKLQLWEVPLSRTTTRLAQDAAAVCVLRPTEGPASLDAGAENRTPRRELLAY